MALAPPGVCDIPPAGRVLRHRVEHLRLRDHPHLRTSCDSRVLHELVVPRVGPTPHPRPPGHPETGHHEAQTSRPTNHSARCRSCDRHLWQHVHRPSWECAALPPGGVWQEGGQEETAGEQRERYAGCVPCSGCNRRTTKM